MQVLLSGLQSQTDPVYGRPDSGELRHSHCPLQEHTPLSGPI